MKYKFSDEFMATLIKFSILSVWFLVTLLYLGFLRFSKPLTDIYKFNIYSYDLLFGGILLVIVVLICCMSSTIYLKSCYVVILILTGYMYVFTQHLYPNIEEHVSSMIGLIFFSLLIVFNLHFIFKFKKYYLVPFINDMVTIYGEKVKLNYYNLIIIMLLIIFSTFFAHYLVYREEILGEFRTIVHNNYADSPLLFISYFTFNYLLTLIFLITVSVHIWINLSIIQPYYIKLIRENCVDLRDRNKYDLFRRLVEYLANSSYLYVLLLISTMVAYKLPNTPKDTFESLLVQIQYEPYVLAIVFIIIMTLNLILFLHINSMAIEFVYARYGKHYQELSHEVALSDDITVIENIIKPFRPKENIIIFISELAPLLYLMNPVLQIIFKILGD